MANSSTSGQNQGQKTKAKFGKKPFAFFSGLFDVIISIAICVLAFFALSGLLSEFNTGNEDLNKLFGILALPILIFILSIFAIGAVLFMILGILTLISSFKSDRRNWNGLLIAVTVIDVLLMFPTIFLIYAQEGNARLFSIVLVVLLVLGLIFKIVDISLTRRRLKKYQAAIQTENSQTYQGPNFGALNTNQPQSTPQEQQPVEPTSQQASMPQSQAEQQADNVNENNNSQDDDSQTPQDGANGVDFSKLGK